MKLGFDSKRLYCNFTGLGNYSRSLLSNLSTYFPEHEYHLYTPKVDLQPKTEAFFNNSNYHTHISTARIKTYWRSFSIRNDLKKDGIDLFHGLSHELPIGLAQKGIKTVVTMHDLIFKVYPETYPLFDRLIYDKKFSYSCQAADKVIAISESTKKDLVRYYAIDPNKIEVVYQTCQPLYYQMAPKEKLPPILKKYHIDGPFLLYVGTIQERKNLKLIVNAYAQLPKAFQLPLVVVGNGGSYKKEMKRFVQQKKLDHLVIWLEKLALAEDLQALYQAASILLYPSFYEGFGLPVAEALLSKTPVITADTSSLREAGGPNSLYVHPNEASDLAAAIQRVLDDSELASTMINKGFEYAHQQFDPKSLTTQMMAIYKGLL